MTSAPAPVGRRERNKQEKRERIIAAAGALFAEHGVEEVTTQQIADAADIGTGTLFLYARSKSELLLLVQNAHYEDALRTGIADAAAQPGIVGATLALASPIVDCNRIHIDNGRTYLREMLFGDSGEPHHAEALRIVAQTEQTLAELIRDRTQRTPEESTLLARVISATLFLTMASAPAEVSEPQIVDSLRAQVEVVLGADT